MSSTFISGTAGRAQPGRPLSPLPDLSLITPMCAGRGGNTSRGTSCRGARHRQTRGSPQILRRKKNLKKNEMECFFLLVIELN